MALHAGKRRQLAQHVSAEQHGKEACDHRRFAVSRPLSGTAQEGRHQNRDDRRPEELVPVARKKIERPARTLPLGGRDHALRGRQSQMGIHVTEPIEGAVERHDGMRRLKATAVRVTTGARAGRIQWTGSAPRPSLRLA